MENTLIPDIHNRIDTSVSLNTLDSFEYNPYQNYDPATALLAINTPFNSFLKRFIDVSVSVLILIILLSWLLPLLAVLIKLTSKGPVFFIQKRNSRYGQVFSCIKLRTMYQNADADFLAAQENDVRITRLGSLLRKYHLDELPQFFNVLSGDMSLIGPRPYMIYENKYYSNLIGGFEFRHSVKPGISGLAQSYGQFGTIKDVEMMRSRLALDHQYILNWSVTLDFKIALRTLKSTFRSI